MSTGVYCGIGAHDKCSTSRCSCNCHTAPPATAAPAPRSLAPLRPPTTAEQSFPCPAPQCKTGPFATLHGLNVHRGRAHALPVTASAEPTLDPRYCSGSKRDPARLTVIPTQHRASSGQRIGNPGRGICPECGRELGLTANGAITSHKRPEFLAPETARLAGIERPITPDAAPPAETPAASPSSPPPDGPLANAKGLLLGELAKRRVTLLADLAQIDAKIAAVEAI